MKFEHILIAGGILLFALSPKSSAAANNFSMGGSQIPSALPPQQTVTADMLREERYRLSGIKKQLLRDVGTDPAHGPLGRLIQAREASGLDATAYREQLNQIVTANQPALDRYNDAISALQKRISELYNQEKQLRG